MIGRLFAPLAMKLAGGLVAVLLLALAMQTWRANHFRDQRDDARTAVAAWKDANAKAVAWAEAERALAIVYDGANKEKADVQLDGGRAATRPVLDRYAAANRCVRVESPAGLGADLPAAGGAAQRVDRAGDAAGLYVGISDRDLRVCADNTLRLETGVSWAANYAAGPAPVGAGAPTGASGVPE